MEGNKIITYVIYSKDKRHNLKVDNIPIERLHSAISGSIFPEMKGKHKANHITSSSYTCTSEGEKTKSN